MWREMPCRPEGLWPVARLHDHGVVRGRKWVYEARPPDAALAVGSGAKRYPIDTPLDMASGAATLPFPQNRPPIHPAVKGLFFRCLQYNS